MIKTENVIKKLDNVKKHLYKGIVDDTNVSNTALDDIAYIVDVGLRDFMYMDDGDSADYTPLQKKFYNLCNSYSIMWLSPNAGWRNVDNTNSMTDNSTIYYLANDLEEFAKDI